MSEGQCIQVYLDIKGFVENVQNGRSSDIIVQTGIVYYYAVAYSHSHLKYNLFFSL